MAKTRQARSRPRTLLQIARILQEYEASCLSGSSTLEAARKVGVPLSNIHRWRAQGKRNLPLPAPEVSSASTPTIEEAIDSLCAMSAHFEQDDTVECLRRVEALAVFVTWLRWPKHAYARQLGLFTYLLTYAHKRYGARRLNELNGQARAFYENYIRLDLLALSCSDANLDFPYFYDYGSIDDQPQNENDCLVDIAAYLISHGKNSSSAQGSASIGKAIFLANRNAFKYIWGASSFTLRKLWRERGVCAPFFYAEHESSLDLPLSPASADFVSSVENCTSQPDVFKTYFSKARWIIDKLQDTLDPKALRSLPFPCFPDDLKPTVVRVRPLTERQMMILGEYRSAPKTLNFDDNPV